VVTFLFLLRLRLQQLRQCLIKFQRIKRESFLINFRFVFTAHFTILSYRSFQNPLFPQDATISTLKSVRYLFAIPSPDVTIRAYSIEQWGKYMSYMHARRCFDENCKMIDAQADPVNWNLNNGLHSLAKTIQIDMARMRQTLDAVVRALQQLQR
jgi:hypothetical protein